MLNKIKVKQECLAHINKQINLIDEAIQDAQDSSNTETKSSAGDKHETSRAMAQLETERLNKQLSKQLQLKEALLKINDDSSVENIALGSLVNTTAGWFYLTVGLGKVLVDNHTVFVSPLHTPVGKLLLNKKVGDSFLFQGKEHVIHNIL